MNTQDKSLDVINLGISEYETVWNYQKELVQRKYNDRSYPDYLLLVEHPDIVTVGRGYAGQPIPRAFSAERGGEATLHNPGQLVAYPILTLHEGERDLHLYLRKLERVVGNALSFYGIASDRKEGATGVWVDGKRKIASIGVAVTHWVTYHGVAINVSNDLKAFQRINPCGFEWTVMTSVERELGKLFSIELFSEKFVEEFKKEFYPLSFPIASTGQEAMASSHC